MEWGLGRSKNTLISQMSDSSQQEAMKQEEEDEYFNGLLIPKIGSKWIPKDSEYRQVDTVVGIWDCTKTTRCIELEGGESTEDIGQIEICLYKDGDPLMMRWEEPLETFLSDWEPAPVTSTVTTDTI